MALRGAGVQIGEVFPPAFMFPAHFCSPAEAGAQLR